MRELTVGLRGRGSLSDDAFDACTGEGYVAPVPGDYAKALDGGLGVVPMLFETLGGFSPDFVQMLLAASAEVENKLSHAQYDEATWSTRTWLSFATQRISVALHTAVAWEITVALDGRGHAASGDPRGRVSGG